MLTTDGTLSLSTLSSHTSNTEDHPHLSSGATIDENNAEEEVEEEANLPQVILNTQHVGETSSSLLSSLSPSTSSQATSDVQMTATRPTVVADVDTNAPPSSSSLSLQEAFLLRKQAFIQQSQRRQEEVERKARDRQAATSHHQINSRGGDKKRVVTFSLPASSSSPVVSAKQAGTHTMHDKHLLCYL